MEENETLKKLKERYQLEKEIYKQRIDKAIDYNNHLIIHAKYHLNLGHLKKMKKILIGDYIKGD